jgi:hypothetical protein
MTDRCESRARRRDQSHTLQQGRSVRPCRSLDVVYEPLRGDTARWGCYLPTTYFFPGGRGRLPLSKLPEYFVFFSLRFCWTGVAMLEEYRLFGGLVVSPKGGT